MFFCLLGDICLCVASPATAGGYGMTKRCSQLKKSFFHLFSFNRVFIVGIHIIHVWSTDLTLESQLIASLLQTVPCFRTLLGWMVNMVNYDGEPPASALCIVQLVFDIGI